MQIKIATEYISINNIYYYFLLRTLYTCIFHVVFVTISASISFASIIALKASLDFFTISNLGALAGLIPDNFPFSTFTVTLC